MHGLVVEIDVAELQFYNRGLFPLMHIYRKLTDEQFEFSNHKGFKIEGVPPLGHAVAGESNVEGHSQKCKAIARQYVVKLVST